MFEADSRDFVEQTEKTMMDSSKAAEWLNATGQFGAGTLQELGEKSRFGTRVTRFSGAPPPGLCV